jgi:hypothetical protein
LLERYWDEAMKKIESFANQILAIPVIEAALADLDTAVAAAQSAATTAQTAATSAQTAVDSQTAENSLVNSYINNFTAPLISADSTGNVIIATHDRVYGDSTLNPTVSVTGATVATGAAVFSVVRVYYDQSSRAGGAVTYQFTVDPASPPVQSGNRHSVGAVTIPAAGTQGGNYVQPPGYVEP